MPPRAARRPRRGPATTRGRRSPGRASPEEVVVRGAPLHARADAALRRCLPAGTAPPPPPGTPRPPSPPGRSPRSDAPTAPRLLGVVHGDEAVRPSAGWGLPRKEKLPSYSPTTRMRPASTATPGAAPRAPSRARDHRWRTSGEKRATNGLRGSAVCIGPPPKSTSPSKKPATAMWPDGSTASDVTDSLPQRTTGLSASTCPSSIRTRPMSAAPRGCARVQEVHRRHELPRASSTARALAGSSFTPGTAAVRDHRCVPSGAYFARKNPLGTRSPPRLSEGSLVLPGDVEVARGVHRHRGHRWAACRCSVGKALDQRCVPSGAYRATARPVSPGSAPPPRSTPGRSYERETKALPRRSTPRPARRPGPPPGAPDACRPAPPDLPRWTARHGRGLPAPPPPLRIPKPDTRRPRLPSRASPATPPSRSARAVAVASARTLLAAASLPGGRRSDRALAPPPGRRA